MMREMDRRLTVDRYSGRFTEGPLRYATNAFTEDGAIIIHQTERSKADPEGYRSVVVLPFKELKRMLITLGL